ncbi:MAG: HPr kinase/phosphatase C-terminal domain-containing protein [Rhodobacteraceae bacterium]|nr:HPr kinase/phosphatase C-terminal domain-containing protein [Paracoccaceae bacterium]
MILHASCVAIAGRAVLITGASGAGKSGLALNLMAFGAALVSDDQTMLTREGDRVIARAPDALKGLIEARGAGLLKVDHAGAARVVLVADLSAPASDRLPERRTTSLLDVETELLFAAGLPNLAAVILQYLKHGRAA